MVPDSLWIEVTSNTLHFLGTNQSAQFLLPPVTDDSCGGPPSSGTHKTQTTAKQNQTNQWKSPPFRIARGRNIRRGKMAPRGLRHCRHGIRAFDVACAPQCRPENEEDGGRQCNLPAGP